MKTMRLFAMRALRLRREGRANRQAIVEWADAMLLLDDHMLADIGMEREEVMGAALTGGSLAADRVPGSAA